MGEKGLCSEKGEREEKEVAQKEKGGSAKEREWRSVGKQGQGIRMRILKEAEAMDLAEVEGRKGRMEEARRVVRKCEPRQSKRKWEWKKIVPSLLDCSRHSVRGVRWDLYSPRPETLDTFTAQTHSTSSDADCKYFPHHDNQETKDLPQAWDVAIARKTMSPNLKLTTKPGGRPQKNEVCNASWQYLEDKRGKRRSGNAKSGALIDSVREHIASFPNKQGHYTIVHLRNDLALLEHPLITANTTNLTPPFPPAKNRYAPPSLRAPAIPPPSKPMLIPPVNFSALGGLLNKGALVDVRCSRGVIYALFNKDPLENTSRLFVQHPLDTRWSPAFSVAAAGAKVQTMVGFARLTKLGKPLKYSSIGQWFRGQLGKGRRDIHLGSKAVFRIAYSRKRKIAHTFVGSAIIFMHEPPIPQESKKKHSRRSELSWTGEARWRWSIDGMQGRGKRDSFEKTRWLAEMPDTFTKCENTGDPAESRARLLVDHDGNTACLARRSDVVLEVRVSIARIAPSLLDLGRVAT
ncbi:hypothetical protein PR048_007916 [Dryococelus australis]|uniref:Uncharacterized protein n=1 Tax=Dryococelus australis TaxID=614101 RepID=A0ABQ9HWF8_9NEOP|nr:hypothetical protein PR048_007916 [Dryococelus australis]